MNNSKYLKLTFCLSLGGVLFSGYLSAYKIFTSTCALSEPCPYFLGYPACWYGFGLFMTIFITTSIAILTSEESKRTAIINLIISGAGIIFALYFTIPEISKIISGTNYKLLLPTCAYGLIFYMVVFVLSVFNIKTPKNAIH